MNSDDIIRWAREAMPEIAREITEDELARFAELVVSAERAACAKLCADMRYNNIEKDWSVGAALCAEAIRERGWHSPEYIKPEQMR